MFRNNLSDIPLFGAPTVAGPRPSFRPAVEGLEERMVLNCPDGSMAMPCPATPAPTPALTGPSDAAVQLFNILKAQNALYGRIARIGSGVDATRKFTTNALQVERGLAFLAQQLILTTDLSKDPLVRALGRAVLDAHDSVEAKIIRLDAAVGRAQAAQIQQGLINFAAKEIVTRAFNTLVKTLKTTVNTYLPQFSNSGK